jgi:hypothetical protein
MRNGEEELENVHLPTVAVWITTYYSVERRVPSLELEKDSRFGCLSTVSLVQIGSIYPTFLENPALSYEIVCRGSR